MDILFSLLLLLQTNSTVLENVGEEMLRNIVVELKP